MKFSELKLLAMNAVKSYFNRNCGREDTVIREETLKIGIIYTIDSLHDAMSAVRAYFLRNWTIEDLMNNGEIPQHAYTSLKRVYLTLFFAMWSFTFGSFLHWTRGVGGLFTVLSSVASLLCLYFISPLRVRMRILLLMIAAFSIGASIGIFIKYFFDIDHDLVYSLLAPPTFSIGFMWFGSMFTRERSDIYLGCLYYSWALCFSTFVASNAEYIDSQTSHFLLKVSSCMHTVYALCLHCSWGTLWYIAKRYCMMLTMEKLTLSIAHSPSSSVYRV
ncbi:bax inhibitor 1-like [Solanum stenotomum]|uniref:bax inhibitor 1-like n=1 Tax=Solanum stenotomum TaxID=172797 RepID=UPI0020D0D1B8|nr:bax inhibitor 1-like [Solanum stenotomum]